MAEQLWWEMLTEDEIKYLAEEFPDYKKYKTPTINMKWRMESYFEKCFREKNKDKK